MAVAVWRLPAPWQGNLATVASSTKPVRREMLTPERVMSLLSWWKCFDKWGELPHESDSSYSDVQGCATRIRPFGAFAHGAELYAVLTQGLAGLPGPERQAVTIYWRWQAKQKPSTKKDKSRDFLLDWPVRMTVDSTARALHCRTEKAAALIWGGTQMLLEALTVETDCRRWLTEWKDKNKGIW